MLTERSMALAALLAKKRKVGSDETGNAKSKGQLYHEIGSDVIQDLLKRNTKTSVKKLRKLGVLKAGETLEEFKESFDRYLEEEKEISDDDNAEGEDGEMEDFAGADKAYETLVVSLASRHRDLGIALTEEMRELQRNIDVNVDDEGDIIQEKETAKEGLFHDAETRKNCETISAYKVELLENANFFGDHVEKSVEDLDDEKVIIGNRKVYGVPDGEFQCWDKIGATLEISQGSSCPQGISTAISSYGVRTRVASRWNSVLKDDKKLFGDFQSKRQAVLFGLMSSYLDVAYTMHKYPSSAGTGDYVTDAALLHIINHIVVSGDKIKKNSDKLKNSQQEDQGSEYQDQGFVRPKVLILAPYRHHAKLLVDRLLQFAIQETRVDTIKNKSRFEDEYGVGEEDQVKSEREKVALSLKPKQHQALFDGNCDDHFRLGIKVTRGSIRLYTDFYDSDILVASPLALSTKLEEGSKTKDEPNPMDFLSSIEIAMTYRADVLLMQNWQHVLKIFDALNRIPKQQHDTDIMRIRDWYVAGKAKFYRQNILLSSFQSPEIKSLLSKHCLNHSGCARWKQNFKGVLASIIPRLRHVFERLESFDSNEKEITLTDDVDLRFEYFKAHMWPKMREASHMGGQLLYIPSYFDFVKVRNFLRSETASFVALCEYTTQKDMARARSYFADNRRRVLLYTERAQFYNRHRIRGIKDVYFYQLPEHPQFYAELGNFIGENTADGGSMMASMHVVFSRYDVLRLERIVGTSRAKKMLSDNKRSADGGTFVFC